MASTLQRKPEGIRSGRNPIEDFLNDVIQEDTEANVQDTWKTYWQRLVLEDCGFDLAKVEAKLREYKGGGIAKARRPFRELMESLPTGSSAGQKRSCWKSRDDDFPDQFSQANVVGIIIMITFPL